jgi:hypothetical protein
MSSPRIVIYEVGQHKRARIIAAAMREGFGRHGVQVSTQDRFNGVHGDIAIAYGWNHEPIFKKYKNYIYFDLGYWDRKPQGAPKEGAHRVCINSWSPVDNMIRDRPMDRLLESGIDLWASPHGGDVLIAAMSAKAAVTHGYNFMQWENEMSSQIRPFTKRGIVLRTKPSKAHPGIPIIEALQNSHIVISHHSNVAVDAMIRGVAVYAEKGIGKLVSISDIRGLDYAKPPCVDDRLQFLADVAYCQWTPEEMRNGKVWENLKNQVLWK